MSKGMFWLKPETHANTPEHKWNEGTPNAEQSNSGSGGGGGGALLCQRPRR